MKPFWCEPQSGEARDQNQSETWQFVLHTAQFWAQASHVHDGEGGGGHTRKGPSCFRSVLGPRRSLSWPGFTPEKDGHLPSAPQNAGSGNPTKESVYSFTYCFQVVHRPDADILSWCPDVQQKFVAGEGGRSVMDRLVISHYMCVKCCSLIFVGCGLCLLPDFDSCLCLQPPKRVCGHACCIISLVINPHRMRRGLQ